LAITLFVGAMLHHFFRASQKCAKIRFYYRLKKGFAKVFGVFLQKNTDFKGLKIRLLGLAFLTLTKLRRQEAMSVVFN